MRAQSNRGFTLIEIILAVAVVAILAGAIAPLAFRQLQAAKEEATRRELVSIQAAITEYHDDTGCLPDSLAGLVGDDGRAGWAGPYLGSDWNDPVSQVSRDAFELDYAYDLNPTVLPAGAADLIVASGGLNRGIDLLSGGSWDLSAIADVDDIVMHISATRLNRDKWLETLAELEAMAEAARWYYLDTGAFPGDIALLSGDYLDPGFEGDNFSDDWNVGYLSLIETDGSDSILHVWSAGPDRVDDNGGNDDMVIDIYSTVLDNQQTAGELGTTEPEILTIQAAIDANPGLSLSGPWQGSNGIRADLGLDNSYDKDEWNRNYNVNVGIRQAYSSGPDHDANTAGDNIPLGVTG